MHPNHSGSNLFGLNILGDYCIKKNCLIPSKLGLIFLISRYLLFSGTYTVSKFFFLNFSLLLNKLIISTF